MTETSVWITAIVPVAAVVLTTLISNTYHSRTQESQQRHEERMKNLELSNAQGVRTYEDKRSAYTAVLSEVAQAQQKHDEKIEEGRRAGKSSMRLYATDLTVAVSRAKLLLEPAMWDEYERVLLTFYGSFYEKTADAQKALADLFSKDLTHPGTAGLTNERLD
ncbi:hypothetical protein [Cryobacterium sp. AP23]